MERATVVDREDAGKQNTRIAAGWQSETIVRVCLDALLGTAVSHCPKHQGRVIYALLCDGFEIACGLSQLECVRALVRSLTEGDDLSG